MSFADVEVGRAQAGCEAVGVGADVAAGVEHRVVHEHVVQELRTLVAGRGVLVEEAEQVHLADAELQAVARQLVEAPAVECPAELVIGLRDDGIGFVGSASGFEAAAVDGAGVGRPRPDAATLAETQLPDRGARRAGDAAQRPADDDVAAVVQPALAAPGIGAAGIDLLGHGDDADLHRRPGSVVGRLDLGRARRRLHVLAQRPRLGLDLLRRGVRRRAPGVGGGGLRRLARAQRLHLAFKSLVALLELLQAVHQLLQPGLQRGRIGRLCPVHRQCGRERGEHAADEQTGGGCGRPGVGDPRGWWHQVLPMNTVANTTNLHLG